MKLEYTKTTLQSLSRLTPRIRKAFYKQADYLLHNIQHPSLHAKKFSEAEDMWQARVTREWRFYFRIANDSYIITDVRSHPK